MPSFEEHIFKDSAGNSHTLKIKRFDRDFIGDEDKCEREVLFDRLSKEAFKLYINSGRKTKIIFENDKYFNTFEELVKSDAKDMMGMEVNNVLLDYPWYPVVQRALLKMDETRQERCSETDMVLKKSSHEILIDDFKYSLKDFWDFRAQTGAYNRSLASSNLLKGTVHNKWLGRREDATIRSSTNSQIKVVSQMELLENGELRSFDFKDTKSRDQVLQIRRFDCIWDWDIKMLALAQEAFLLFKQSEGDVKIILDKNRAAHKALITQENLDETLKEETRWAYIVSLAILGVFWLASTLITAIFFAQGDEEFVWNGLWTAFTVSCVVFIVCLFYSILWATTAELRTTLTLDGKAYSYREFNLFRKLIGATPLYVPDIDHTLAHHDDV